MRRVVYIGTGTTTIEGVGQVSHGQAVPVPDALGEALVAERPDDWAEEAEAGTGGDEAGESAGGGE